MLGLFLLRLIAPYFNQWSVHHLSLININDIIITGSSTGDIQTLIQQLNNEFSLKDLGDLHYFLGIEVNKTIESIHLS